MSVRGDGRLALAARMDARVTRIAANAATGEAGNLAATSDLCTVARPSATAWRATGKVSKRQVPKHHMGDAINGTHQGRHHDQQKLSMYPAKPTPPAGAGRE